MLSSGIVGFAGRFPSYVEGDLGALPEAPGSPSPRKKERSRHSSSRSHSSGSSARSRSGQSTAATLRALSTRGPGGSSSSHYSSSRYNRRDDDDDKLSRMSELSVADSVISRATARKSRY